MSRAIGLLLLVAVSAVPLAGCGREARHDVRVSIEQVEKVGTALKLKATARDLGLGQGDDRQARTIERLPGS